MCRRMAVQSLTQDGCFQRRLMVTPLILHIQVLTGLGEDCCLCEQSSINPFIAQGEAARASDVTEWPSCIVGDVGFKK